MGATPPAKRRGAPTRVGPSATRGSGCVAESVGTSNVASATAGTGGVIGMADVGRAAGTADTARGVGCVVAIMPGAAGIARATDDGALARVATARR